MRWQELPPLSKAYFLILLGVAGLLAITSLWIPYRGLLSAELLLFVAMGCVTARMNVKIPYVDAHFSVDTGFVFAILMIYGILPAVAVEVVTKTLFTVPKVSRRTAYRVPFNIASGIVAAFAAGMAYRLMLNGLQDSPWIAQVVATLTMVLVYYFINTFSVALMLSILQAANVFRLWWENFAWTILGFLVSGSIATVLYCLNAQTRALGIVMTVPIVAMAYFSNRLYLQSREPSSKD